MSHCVHPRVQARRLSSGPVTGENRRVVDPHVLHWNTVFRPHAELEQRRQTLRTPRYTVRRITSHDWTPQRHACKTHHINLSFKTSLYIVFIGALSFFKESYSNVWNSKHMYHQLIIVAQNTTIQFIHYKSTI